MKKYRYVCLLAYIYRDIDMYVFLRMIGRLTKNKTNKLKRVKIQNDLGHALAPNTL